MSERVLTRSKFGKTYRAESLDALARTKRRSKYEDKLCANDGGHSNRFGYVQRPF